MISRMKRSHLSDHETVIGQQVVVSEPRNMTGGIYHDDMSSWLAPSKASSALLVPRQGFGSVHIPPDAERIGFRNLLLGKQSASCDLQSSRDWREFEDRELDCKHEVSY